MRCGVIANAYFNQPDGWYYVDGIIWDDKAQDLINKGWSVSCSYDYLAFNDEGGEENNIHYDKEFTQLNFTHLAIVDNPRYERANIVFNSKINNEEEQKGKWITIKGNHIFIPDGKTLDEVIKEKGWGDKEGSKNKEYKAGDKITFDTNWRGVNPKIQEGEVLGKEKKLGSHGDANPDYQYKVKLSDEKTILVDKEAIQESKDKQSDTKDKQSGSKPKTVDKPNIDKINFANKMNGDGPILVKGEKRCETYKDTYKYILERTEKIFENAKKERSPLQSFEAGLRNLNGNYAIRDVLRDKQEQYHKITQQITEYQNSLKEQLKDNKTNNSKEQDMAIIDELKKLIFKVENNKENETMVENEKVDKRKLIDEVAGIMKSAGCDDEDIRTAIGKMEKIGYDDSEASADNKKVKNEADEEDKKVDNEEDEKEEDKVDNESEEDKEKAEELKKEEKKDVDNKCKNSKEENYFDKLNKIYNSAKKIEEPSVEYESKQARLEAGKEYFG